MIQVQGKMNRKRRRSGKHRKDEEHNREKQRQEETCRQNNLKKNRVKIDLPCQINHTPHKLSGKHRAALETRWGGTLPQF